MKIEDVPNGTEAETSMESRVKAVDPHIIKSGPLKST
jgi:hypothetical protein